MQTELVAAPREETGKEAAKKMRHDGRIPAVLYGHGFDTRLLSLDEKDFKTLLRHGLHGLLNLKVEGAKEGAHTVVVKEVQRDPIKDYILHVDFQKIRGDEELNADVSLQFVGEPVGIKAGGILQHNLYEITVQCLPKDLPEYIEVDISALDIKDNLRVSDLVSIEGVKYLNNPEEIVAAVAPKRVKEEVKEAEELFEGEVPEEEAAEGAEAEASSQEETE
ncbi:MAG: 50S ribosomal protein L25/general stress protein Ctc [Actinobacteria bacterium]|jgi:large subunit ribosomal protein L25|nr:MAG: 50S ribosomal protein L25/general stress protein Ctc [Actinomycetota bacterium]